MIEDVRALVEIESPSHDVEGVTAVAVELAAMITARLGRRPDLIETDAGPIVHLTGSREPRALVIGHHDTVFPRGALAVRPFRVDDNVATGPGVFDMKAGLVMAIHALALLAASDPDLADGVELLFTPDEEVGSHASRRYIEDRAVAAGAVLVLEPSADGGALKLARKGVGTFEVTVTGRASHAGLEPEKGVNALLELAHQVVDVAALADPERGTTVTPTIATAGTADNVVPASATMRVDVRVTELDEAARIESAFAHLTRHVDGTAIAVDGGVNRPPMPDGSAGRLWAVASAAARRAGLDELRGVGVGGGSDGNFTAALGVSTLDGLGAVGGGAHADHEFVLVDQLEPRTRMLAEILRTI